MEKIYIGTKVIAAEPMDHATFSLNVRPFHNIVEIGPDGKGNPGYKVRYEDGYISWSPKETFERAYRELTQGEFMMIALPSSGGIPVNLESLAQSNRQAPWKTPSDLPIDLKAKD